MKTFFFMGLNPSNKSGVSWKIWKIMRRGQKVQVWWGPAKIIGHKVLPAFLQTQSWVFKSEALAKASEQRRVTEKLAGGYELKPRRR